MALLLRRKGIARVRPLAGGLAAWHASLAVDRPAGGDLDSGIHQQAGKEASR